MSPPPQVVDDRNYHQRQDRGRHHPAHHRGCDPLHDARPRPVTPQRRHEPEHDRQDGHDLWSHAVDRAMLDRRDKICYTPCTTHHALFLPRVIEVDEHHDAGFRSHASESDKSHRDRDRQVVVEQPRDPHAAHERERQRQHHDRRLGYGTEGEIQEQRDDPEREGDDDPEPRLHPLNRLVLTAPAQPVAGGELHLARHDALSVTHVAPHVPPPHVDRHLVVQVTALAPDHRWAGAELNVGDLSEGHLRAVTAADQQPADRGWVIPEIAGVAHLYGVALAALDGRGDLLPAERQADHLLRVARGESIAGEGIRIRPDVQVAPPKRPLGVYARRARERRERALDILTDPLNDLEVGA